MTPTPEELREISTAGGEREAARKREVQQATEARYQKGKTAFFEAHRTDWITAIEELQIAHARLGKYTCKFSKTSECDQRDHAYYSPLMYDLQTHFYRQGFKTYIDTDHWTESGSDAAGYPDTDTWTLTLSWKS